jgi:hypothetical protein
MTLRADPRKVLFRDGDGVLGTYRFVLAAAARLTGDLDARGSSQA